VHETGAGPWKRRGVKRSSHVAARLPSDSAPAVRLRAAYPDRAPAV